MAPSIQLLPTTTRAGGSASPRQWRFGANWHLIDLFLRVRPAMIIALTGVSGYTTWRGLTAYVPWTVSAIVLATVSQAFIVISTVQIARSSFRMMPGRMLVMWGGLALAVSVSSFFSYLTFFNRSEGTRLAQARLDLEKIRVRAFADSVVAMRQAVISKQRAAVDSFQLLEGRAIQGRSASGDTIKRGEGPISKFYKGRKDAAAAALDGLLDDRSVDSTASSLRSYLANLSIGGRQADTAAARLRNDLSVLVAGADRVTRESGVSKVQDVPSLSPASDYADVRATFQELTEGKRFSPLAAALALIFESFTLLMTASIEWVRYGRLKPRERAWVVEQLLEFTDWGIGGSNQAGFDLAVTDDERGRHYNPANRLFIAARLLQLGYLKRVSEDRVEFTPALYEVLVQERLAHIPEDDNEQ